MGVSIKVGEFCNFGGGEISRGHSGMTEWQTNAGHWVIRPFNFCIAMLVSPSFIF